MSENTPHNPQQGDSAAAGYGYDAEARPAQDASLTGQPAQAAQPAQPTQPTQPTQPRSLSSPPASRFRRSRARPTRVLSPVSPRRRSTHPPRRTPS